MAEASKVPRLKIGDVVQLNSGGPKMTVVDLGGGHGLLCLWHKADGTTLQQNFPEEALTKIE